MEIKESPACQDSNWVNLSPCGLFQWTLVIRYKGSGSASGTGNARTSRAESYSCDSLLRPYAQLCGRSEARSPFLPGWGLQKPLYRVLAWL